MRFLGYSNLESKLVVARGWDLGRGRKREWEIMFNGDRVSAGED